MKQPALIKIKKKGKKEEYWMTPELEKRLEKVEEDIKHKRNFSPSFKTGKEMDDYLRKVLA